MRHILNRDRVSCLRRLIRAAPDGYARTRVFRIKCVVPTDSVCSTSLMYLDYFVTYDISKTDTKLAEEDFEHPLSPDVSLDHCASSQDFDLTFIYLEVPPRGKYNYNVLKWSLSYGRE